MIVGRHLEKTRDRTRRQASVRDPSEGLGQTRHGQHHQPMALVRMSTLVLDDGGQLRLVQQSQRARTDDDARSDTGQAVGDRGRVIERQCPSTDRGGSGEKIEQATVACSGKDRSHDDDTDHAEEHDTDVGRQRQTECVGQAESLEGMSTDNPLPEFTHAAQEAGVKSLGGDAQAGPDGRQRGAHANAMPERNRGTGTPGDPACPCQPGTEGTHQQHDECAQDPSVQVEAHGFVPP